MEWASVTIYIIIAISFLQFSNESEQEIAYYNPDTKQFSVLYNITASPQGSAEAIPYTIPPAFVVLDSTIISLCFLYVRNCDVYLLLQGARDQSHQCYCESLHVCGLLSTFGFQCAPFI